MPNLSVGGCRLGREILRQLHVVQAFGFYGDMGARHTHDRLENIRQLFEDSN